MFAELGDKMYLVNVCVRVGAEAHVRTSSICDLCAFSVIEIQFY